MSATGKPVLITAFGRSDIGLVRKNNEDTFLVADLTSGSVTPDSAALNHVVGEKGSLFLVADGMGGAEAGEVASQMAVELVVQETLDELENAGSADRETFVNILKRSIENANLAILQESRRNAHRRGMGTTLTAAAANGASIIFAQLGDSRAYLARNGRIAQMTRDQTLVAQMVAAGTLKPEEARQHPQRNVILQALGVQERIDVVLSCADLKRGDRVVLCSDGLSGKVDAEEVKESLEASANPEDACRRLIALARQRGGEDNITAVVAQFDGEGLPRPEPEEIPVYSQFEFKKSKRRHFFFWSRSD
jgi:protein phosphatase